MGEWHARKKGHVGKMGGRVGWCQQPLGCRMAFIKQKQKNKKDGKNVHLSSLEQLKGKAAMWCLIGRGNITWRGRADTCWC